MAATPVNIPSCSPDTCRLENILKDIKRERRKKEWKKEIEGRKRAVNM
jgi:hypothetical protein